MGYLSLVFSHISEKRIGRHVPLEETTLSSTTTLLEHSNDTLSARENAGKLLFSLVRESSSV